MGVFMKKSLGFTLIELMIVVAIVAILSAFSMSSYTQYVARAERKEVQTEMLEIAARLEQYYSLNNSYALTGLITQPGVPFSSKNGKYDIEVFNRSTAAEAAFGIEVKAKVGSTAARDSVAGVLCTPLSLNSATTKTPIQCWD
jgi:type IV pilus assembly protein PilE